MRPQLAHHDTEGATHLTRRRWIHDGPHRRDGIGPGDRPLWSFRAVDPARPSPHSQPQESAFRIHHAHQPVLPDDAVARSLQELAARAYAPYR
jgi:hypothetical protein